MVHLITGRAGYAHVTAADEAKINKAMYGNIEGAVDYGNNLAISMPSGNSVVIDTGLICMQGRWIDIPAAETLTIENGNAGLNRNDLVVLRYKADTENGVETAELAIKKGTAAAVAVDPELVTGDIDSGALINEMALYRIPLTGINAGEPVKLFETMHVRLGDQLKVTVTQENGINVCRIERVR